MSGFLAGASVGALLGAAVMGFAVLRSMRAAVRRARAGLAATVGDPMPPDASDHEVQVHDVTCLDGHKRVGVYCPICRVGGGICWGPGCTSATREAALGQVYLGLRSKLPSAPHALPEGTAIEVSVEDMPS